MCVLAADGECSVKTEVKREIKQLLSTVAVDIEFGDESMNIQGKVALITGASRGIGRAIALQLAQQGAQRLILIARDCQKLAEVAQEIEQMGVEATIMSLDLTKPAIVNIAVAQLWRSYWTDPSTSQLRRCRISMFISAIKTTASARRAFCKLVGNVHTD